MKPLPKKPGLRCPHCSRDIGGFLTPEIVNEWLRSHRARKTQLGRNLRKQQRVRAEVYLRRLIVESGFELPPNAGDRKLKTLTKEIVDLFWHELGLPDEFWATKQDEQNDYKNLTAQVEKTIVEFFTKSE